MRSPSHPALPMRPLGHPALRRGIQGIPASLLVRFSFLDPASLCGLTRFSTWYPGYTRCLYHFSRKRKGKAKRKLPADVRKLKNDCEVRGKRTRRARFAAAVRQALLPRALRLIRSGSNIFFLCSSLSVIFLSAFSHRPDGFALRASSHTDKITRKIHFPGPRIGCGVTRCASSAG